MHLYIDVSIFISTEMERAQDQYVVKYNTKIEELMEMIDQIYDEIYKLVVLFNLNEIVEDNMPFHQGLYQQTRTYKVIWLTYKAIWAVLSNTSLK